jgi:hypothetical protein
MAARVKARVGFDRSELWDRGFESLSKHGCMLSFFYIVLFSMGRGLVRGRSLVQRVLLKYLKVFTVSEVNSESEQARGLNL